MDNQHMIVFRHTVTGEDLGVFPTSGKPAFEPGQSVSIPTQMNGIKVDMVYIIDKVLDSVVLCTDPKF